MSIEYEIVTPERLRMRSKLKITDEFKTFIKEKLQVDKPVIMPPKEVEKQVGIVYNGKLNNPQSLKKAILTIITPPKGTELRVGTLEGNYYIYLRSIN